LVNDDKCLKIKNNPKFQELVKKRSLFAWILSAIILFVYYAFILIIAFYPEIFGTPIYDGAITTLGIPAGLFVIFLCFVLTGIYVKRTNGEFDALNKQIIEEAKQ
jgi:uncharacterized membrane protein (DUF485 family)